MPHEMTRRTAIAALLSFACPVGYAQKTPKIGWLILSSTGIYAEITSRGYLTGLREAGFEEGRNLVIERRSAGGDVNKLPALARELVATAVDVIFAPAKAMADAAWYAS